MRIALTLPRRRLWGWHQRLAEALAADHALDIFMADGPAYPGWLEAWLKLEAKLAKPNALTRRLGPDAFAAAGAAPGDDYDLTLDLSENAAALAAAARRLTYDGQADSLYLLGRLQQWRTPFLAVEDAAGARASSYPEIPKGLLRDRLRNAFARAVTLLLRAVEEHAGGPAGAVEPAPARTPAKASLFGLAPLALRRARQMVAYRLGGKLTRPEHWTIGLRKRIAGAPFESAAGFKPEPATPDLYYADPFLFEHEGRAYLFVEAFPYETSHGYVACAEITEAGLGPYETVLERPYHLSYPQVFAHEGAIYMLPETSQNKTVELYRAAQFPKRWELAHTLVADAVIKDASVFQHEGRWWMFGSAPREGGSSLDELFAWHAPALTGPWTPHAIAPLRSDARCARPGGRPFVHEGKLYRMAQDCEHSYGEALAWLEIEELTPTTFRERLLKVWRGRDMGAFDGVHTYDASPNYEVVDLRYAIRR